LVSHLYGRLPALLQEKPPLAAKIRAPRQNQPWARVLTMLLDAKNYGRCPGIPTICRTLRTRRAHSTPPWYPGRRIGRQGALSRSERPAFRHLDAAPPEPSDIRRRTADTSYLNGHSLRSSLGVAKSQREVGIFFHRSVSSDARGCQLAAPHQSLLARLSQKCGSSDHGLLAN
jgi:hypothetical protein